ncbi:unnamed protein product [Tilletia controversa]|nr:unnamed protein product [Tilletia controversa]
MPITIPDTKEAALAFHQATVHTTFPQQLHVYTDGSGHDGRYGAAAHFRGGNAVSRPADLRIGLGRMSTVYRSEATAMRAALEVLPAGVRAYVWTDSRAVALALRKPGTTDPDIQASQAILREHGDKISVAWMPGHVDDEGNDAADAAAKEAADLDAPTASEEPAASQRAHLLREVGWKKAQSLSSLLNDSRMAREALRVAAARFDCYREEETPNPDAGAGAGNGEGE